MIEKARSRVTISSVTAGGPTLIQGPQAEVGLPVELFHTCWPRGGLENVPLPVPGSLVMNRPLTLHIQVRLRCQRDTDQIRRHWGTKEQGNDETSKTNVETLQRFQAMSASNQCATWRHGSPGQANYTQSWMWAPLMSHQPDSRAQNREKRDDLS